MHRPLNKCHPNIIEKIKTFLNTWDLKCDCTALHIFLQNQWGWPTLHGPSGYQAAYQKISDNSFTLLKRILFCIDEIFSYDNLISLNNAAKNSLELNGLLIGGNLHLIQASLGTFWQMNAMNKILFIEEINERAYRIDRVLTQLSQAGIISQAKAILFGDFIDKGEPDGRFLVQEVLHEFALQCSLPVFQICNVGHGIINNPLLLGSMAKIT